MIVVGLVACAVAALLALLLTGTVRRLAPRWGLVDEPGERKIHQAPTPLGGGLAVGLSVALTIAGGVAVTWLPPEALPAWVPESVRVHFPGVRHVSVQLALVLGGGLALLLLGLLDDLRGLSVRVRFGVQAAVALALALCGIRAELFLGGLGVAGEALGIAVTVLWIVGVTNSFNLLDNSDGQCAGIAVVTGSVLAGIAFFSHQYFVGCLLLALVGACLGFLRWNFPPASIFLGDAGSTVIGFWLAVSSVIFTFYTTHYPLYAILVPLLVLTVPLYDTASVILIRLRSRKPLFVGDRNHFAHRLMALGLSARGALLVILLLTLVSGLSAMFLYKVRTVGALLLALQIVAVLTIVAVLERAGRARQGSGQASGSAPPSTGL
ncbi:MAG: undecaprenyl/decaprenyl-phosphate alpha-N-acetylglucosaminyl 1-phosphate transferase [Planctomycetales bacterium]|nr:undecaprenyl/decaprenyl-phosphate alpha-N-acetylglucosaminyl 1-phosphate transferase [Planctomycetales bacterium]